MTPTIELLLLIAEHARFPRHIYPQVAALIAVIRAESNPKD